MKSACAAITSLLLWIAVAVCCIDYSHGFASVGRNHRFLIDKAHQLQDQLEESANELELWNDFHDVAQEMLTEGLYEEARECWTFSLSFRNDAGVRERLAITLREAGYHQQAAKELHKVIRQLTNNDEDGSKAASIAWLYLDLGHMVETIAPLPNTGTSWNKDISYHQIGWELLSPLDCYRAAIDLDPTNGLARKKLADGFAAVGKYRESLVAFKEAAKLLPDDICCATHLAFGERPGRNLSPLPLPRKKLDQSSFVNTIDSLQASPENVEEAANIFEETGIIVFKGFLSSEECKVLESCVEEAMETKDEATDFSMETRSSQYRLHKSLSVEKKNWNSIYARLTPVLRRILQTDKDNKSMPLLGSGFMKTLAGASAQELHKDVHGYDRHEGVKGMLAPGFGSGPRAVSIQFQLTDSSLPWMGSLEVLPASHRPDAVNGHSSTIRDALVDDVGVVPICVPEGTVTIYSSRLWHRGGTNGSIRDRVFCFGTVMEPDSRAPAGLIHTMNMKDVGKWAVGDNGLEEFLPSTTSFQ